jgi:hypothetical protein
MQLISRLGFPRNSGHPGLCCDWWTGIVPFIFYRWFEAETGMAAPGIVETLNVLRDREGGRRPGLPSVAVDQLVFDRREEALADGIIPTIAFTVHESAEERLDHR